MNRLIVLLLCALCLHATPARAAFDVARLADFVDGAVADGMQRDRLAGVSVAIVGRDAVLMAKGYGISALSPRTRMTADTLCRVGSVSKTIVWIALMQLVEQGRIKLSDPINRYLPKPLQVPDEGFTQPILVWHLMSHTAGFEQSVLGHMVVEDPRRELPLKTYVARYRPHRVLPPGEIGVYSNYGTDLAGVLVSEVSGMPWEEFAERQVLRPLGMRLTTFREALPADVAAGRGLPKPIDAAGAAMLSRGFQWENDRLEEAPPEVLTHYGPAAGMVANANDMAAYMRALLNPEVLEASGVLTAQSLHTMLEPLVTNPPGFGTTYHGFFQIPLPGSRFAFGHDGETYYQHSTMIVAPDLGLGIFVGTNTSSGKDLVQRLPRLIGSYLLGENPAAVASPPSAAQVRPNAAPEIADSEIVGNYRAVRRAYFRTERAFLNLKAVSVKLDGNGDALVSGLYDNPVRSEGEATRFAPVGNGAYQEPGTGNRIEFRRKDGDLLLLQADVLEPQQRIGFFAGSTWLLLIVLLAHVAAVGGSIQLVRDAGSRRGSDDGGGAWHIGAALWLVAFALTWISIAPWLVDTEALLTQYPGMLFPVACWLFAAAALITTVLTIAVLVARPRVWSWRRWTGVAASYVIFISCAVTLRYWGLLGFSGW
ncbi:MAG: serine hydrolase domain-containing protein [Gammaproteobacteria bacterium]